MNEVYLHLLSRLEHEESCTRHRCHARCGVQEFLSSLEEPLLLVDQRQHERERERLTALSKGKIPEVV